jgi:UDP-N-acetylmuramyl pentapeptide synthase
MKNLLLAWYNVFLRRCARRVIQRTRPYVVGVTGSVGKTTVRLIVSQTIQQLVPGVKVLTSPKNFNGDMGFSLSILSIDAFTPSFWGYVQ